MRAAALCAQFVSGAGITTRRHVCVRAHPEVDGLLLGAACSRRRPCVALQTTKVQWGGFGGALL